MMNKISVRPDQGWSWVVAAACCFASLVLSGIFRTSGVLFVAFISDFGVTREEASWPMVLCISVLNLTGPFSGILARKFGGRPVIITGAVVAALGISACYLTTSLKVITILFGGVFGVGYGFMNTIMPGILNAYFLNLRATANGIANSGSCVGSMILPIAFEHFISTYGLSGCFLLTGGIVLHITIAGALMRPPPWLSRKVTYPTSQDVEKSVPKKELVFIRSAELSEGPSSTNTSPLVISNPNNQGIEEKTNGTAATVRVESDPGLQGNSTVEESVPGPREEVQFNDLEVSGGVSLTNAQSSEAPAVEQSGSQVVKSLTKEFNQAQPDDKQKMTLDHSSDETTRCACLGSTCGFLERQFKTSQSEIIQPFKSVLTCPMFYVTGITNVTFYFLYHMYVVIIVDYALDIGVPDHSTKYILFAFSLADLFGRLCLGWITDRQFVSRTRFVMGCMVMIGIVFFMFPSAKDYWSLIAVSSSYGLLLGCTMAVFPILLVDFLGIELHSVSYGCMCFMNGLSSFGRPFLIGYFRDSVGSYSSMFYVLGTISVVAAMLWLLEGIFQKKEESQ